VREGREGGTRGRDVREGREGGKREVRPVLGVDDVDPSDAEDQSLQMRGEGHQRGKEAPDELTSSPEPAISGHSCCIGAPERERGA
jgi:hypothetical protein